MWINRREKHLFFEHLKIHLWITCFEMSQTCNTKPTILWNTDLKSCSVACTSQYLSVCCFVELLWRPLERVWFHHRPGQFYWHYIHRGQCKYLHRTTREKLSPRSTPHDLRLWSFNSLAVYRDENLPGSSWFFSLSHSLSSSCEINIPILHREY